MQALREVARVGARADLLARAIEHRPRRVDRERVVDPACELVHRREDRAAPSPERLLPRYCASAFSAVCGMSAQRRS